MVGPIQISDNNLDGIATESNPPLMMTHIHRLFCLIGINVISDAAFATKRVLVTTNSFDKCDLAPKITTNDTRRVATNLVSLGLRVQLYPGGAKLENLVDKITNGVTRLKFGICREYMAPNPA